MAGFTLVSSDNVFKVCDEPHPLMVKEMLEFCSKSEVNEAYKILNHLWKLGYSSEDLITSVFRVCKSQQMDEYLKLEFIKEIGFTHMKICSGVNSLLQMTGLISKMCLIADTHFNS